MNLTSVPAGMDSFTQVLSMSKNNFVQLEETMFLNSGLISLQKLSVADCYLDKVHQEVFQKLSGLLDLDLSGNFLQQVPHHSFVNIQFLTSLNLAKNPIKTIRFLDFVTLPHLKTLNLTSCEISSISRHGFTGLNSLQKLSLSKNHLISLNDVPIFPASLLSINLGSNPWHCDCNLKQLRHWLDIIDISHDEDPECHLPFRFKGIHVVNVIMSELICKPKVSQTSPIVTLTTNRTFSINCIVHSDPPARISWTLDGTHFTDNLRKQVKTTQYKLVTVSKLIIHHAVQADSGVYTCEVENLAGEVSADYNVTVQCNPEG